MKSSTTSAEINRPVLRAKRYYSGFDLAHDTYNAISAASDGKIYYVLSSESYKEGGQLHVYDPETDTTQFLADLTEICGEKGDKTIPQGKCHSRFYERNKKLFFSTHVGVYETIDGLDRLPKDPPDGYKLYPGGHLLSHDLISGEFEDLAVVSNGEGIVTMTMDRNRGNIFGITWPRGHFIHYNTDSDQLKEFQPISGNGEAGIPGEDFRSLCRSLLVEPEEGTVYFSTSEGDIYSLNPGSSSIKKVEGVDLRLDYFGNYNPAMPGTMAYNWRQIVWYPPEKVAYGVHGNSGYLFRFDPYKPAIELIDRITSEPSKRSGMYDQFSYGYLGFDLGPDGETLYYLTGGPVYTEKGNRVEGVDEIARGAARGIENLHLITYHIPTDTYHDHGPVFYEDGTRPTYVNSIAIGPEGHVYTLARYKHNDGFIQDLVKIQNPISNRSSGR